MKLIVAVVRPFKLDDLIVELENIEGFPGMTVLDAEGFGQRTQTPADALSPLKPNKRIEIAAPDEMVESIVEAIKAAAHTGRKGDGFLIVLGVMDSTLI